MYRVAVFIEMKHLTYTYLGLDRVQNLSSQYRAVIFRKVQSSTSRGWRSPSRLRRFSCYEEREKVVNDVSCGNACDVGVIVCGCDFDDVRAPG